MNGLISKAGLHVRPQAEAEAEAEAQEKVRVNRDDASTSASNLVPRAFSKFLLRMFDDTRV